MKKRLTSAVASTLLLLMSCQQVQAWTKCCFGIGCSGCYVGGGNCLFYGMIKSAPFPDPALYGGAVAGGPAVAPVVPPVDGPVRPWHGPNMPPAPIPGGTDPEKLSNPPLPVKPANYSQTQQLQGYQQPQDAQYAYPSYWYDR